MDEARTKLSPRISAGLDVARALAASYVVLHHVANARGWSHGLGLLFRFGQEAVLVFFLLSGFVIFANERSRALSPKGYYIRRIRRIYPGVIIVIIISTAIAIDNGDFLKRFNWWDLFATLASLQDISSLKPGVIADPFLGNDPLWSLSYEMAFYLAFPFVLRAWSQNPGQTGMIVGVVCCTAYALFVAWPNHACLVVAYFLVWWSGAMAADAYLRGARDFRAFLPTLGWLALQCAISAVVVKLVGYKGLGFYPFLPFRHFAAGLAMLIVFSSPVGKVAANWCLPIARPAAYCASISYGLYVLHYPILVDWDRAKSPAGLAMAAVLLIVSAYLADRQLNIYLPRAPRN
ncbi:acyltransferase [Novosphingobium sp. Fuku2-ISO-50]|uniref:acyltransferase family protein n=1 Tax=Novosphingobium sp. Fuku2-ISO-50 TaxID=1739114 RepID=UPI00076C9FB9|nr:acyltransferase [Novosphingobium sp. Fuku2-ISO-50]KUR75523.1 hypothetical protein AQZ50_15355 [Novosphingobium sp. Fuku2-ISO-50]